MKSIVFGALLLLCVVCVGCTQVEKSIEMSGTCQFKAFDQFFDYSDITDLVDGQSATYNSNIFVNPCKPTYCPSSKSNDSAVCSSHQTSYGSLKDLHVAKSHLYSTIAPAFEFSYGNGELCNSGVPRKSIITFVCDVNAQDREKYTVVNVNVDDCTTSATIFSAGACPTTPETGCPIGFLVFTIICVLLFKCTLVFCTLYLCRRRRSPQSKNIKGTAAKRIGNRLLNKRISSKKSTKATSANISQDFGPVYSLVPGGFVVTNDYDVPMVQLSTPQTETV
eukprot:TRINITY_DN22304_c0_g1_i1.p1 TRINITY_DN22304_c0_g1~~TRINITY_DN22304_c0_g1_i1.p1  ORF type:complete len:292 (-),score=54.99 TRINITY_DN22304_c0_g1_i1:88-924(-)